MVPKTRRFGTFLCVPSSGFRWSNGAKNPTFWDILVCLFFRVSVMKLCHKSNASGHSCAPLLQRFGDQMPKTQRFGTFLCVPSSEYRWSKWHHLITETLKKGHARISRNDGLQLGWTPPNSPEVSNQESNSGEGLHSCNAWLLTEESTTVSRLSGLSDRENLTRSLPYNHTHVVVDELSSSNSPRLTHGRVTVTSGVEEITQMGRAYVAYGGVERCIQGFSGETWGKETTWKTQA
jgi:hypothetical protein